MDSLMLAGYVIREYNKRFFITNLSLQKVLYIIQNRLLKEGFSGTNIIEDEFVASNYGPIIRNVYDKYRIKGAQNLYPLVTDDKIDNFKNNLQPTVLKIIDRTINEFITFSSWDLVNLTNKEKFAWDRTRKSGNTIINKYEIMKDCL